MLTNPIPDPNPIPNPILNRYGLLIMVGGDFSQTVQCRSAHTFQIKTVQFA